MRILFVAMPDSVHAGRWISQLVDEKWNVDLFPAYEGPVIPALRGATSYGLSFRRPAELDSSVRLRGIWPLERGVGAMTRYGPRMLPKMFARAGWLAGLIRRLKPDIVHSLEIQHAGYLTLEAKRRLGGSFPPWIVSNWGSDISYYGRFAEHQGRIHDVMANCDYVHAECHRDIRLSREFGFEGDAFAVLPGGGGFDLEQMRTLRQVGPSSSRRLVVLNGKQGVFGRALVGVRALALCAEALKGYRIALPLATPDVNREALRLAEKTGLVVDPQTERISRERLLALHGAARVSIRLGVGDAASHTLLEAMPLGSFPIVACTACADEWIVDGESGLVVPPEDPDAVAEAIHTALANDDLVDQAAERNAKVAAERLDERVVRPQVVARYREVLEARGGKEK